MRATSGADLLAIRSSFRYMIETVLPISMAVVCTWLAGWFTDPQISIWPAIMAVITAGFIVRFDVNLIQHAASYRLAITYALLLRSAAVGFICLVSLWVDGVRGALLQSVVVFTLLTFFTTTIGTVSIVWLSLRPKFRRPYMKLAIVAVTEASVAFAKQLEKQPFLALKFIGYIEDRSADRIPDHAPYPILCRMNQVKAYYDKNPIDHVLISLPLQAELRFKEVLESLLDTTASVHYLHDFSIFKPIRQAITTMGNMSVFTIIDSAPSGVSMVAKRFFDITLSSIALVLLSPLMIATAICIKLDSVGSVLFHQNRWGDNAAPFKIFKFRSMAQVKTENAAIVQATKGDMRVTKVGAFIRRTSIDELPQLFNILRGDMSLVGPRPHAIAHNQEYRGLIKGYMLRHKIKPGLTGWAQIHGFRGETDTLDKMESRVEYDLEYLRNWTPALDLYIIYRTVGLVLRKTNAY